MDKRKGYFYKNPNMKKKKFVKSENNTKVENKRFSQNI